MSRGGWLRLHRATFGFIVSIGLLLQPSRVLAEPTFHGVVLDQTGAVIPSARVTAVPEGSTRGLTSIGDQRGEFVLNLPPGRYTITIAADGFLDTTESITTADSPSQSRRSTLAIAGIQDTVSVSARGGY